MHREGHIGAGLLAYTPFAFLVTLIAGLEFAFIGGVAIAGLSTVPDLDMRVPLVSHRGPTHTLWFAGLIGVLAGLGGLALGLDQGLLAGIGLFVLGTGIGTMAIVSHIAADALTPMGVQPLKPWREDHYTWDLFTASNPIANYAILGIGLLGAALAAGAGLWLRTLF